MLQPPNGTSWSCLPGRCTPLALLRREADGTMSRFSHPSPGRMRGHAVLLELGILCPRLCGPAGVIAGEVLRSLYKKGLSRVRALPGRGSQPAGELPVVPGSTTSTGRGLGC